MTTHAYGVRRCTAFRKILVFFLIFYGCSAKVDAQIITTLAGIGISAGWSDPISDDYQAGLGIDALGNLYMPGAEIPCLRKITPTGVVTIIAGNTTTAGSSGDGGAASSSMLSLPYDVKVDNAGNIYIADLGNHKVRKIDASSGNISTLISGIDCSSLAIDGSNNLYIACSEFVKKYDMSSGGLTIVAGSGTIGFSGDGGPATAANLNAQFITVNASNEIFVSDAVHRIRKIDIYGNINTIAGGGGATADGVPATSADITGVGVIACNSIGDIFFVDRTWRVRKVNTSGIISTIAGIANSFGYNGDCQPATAAQITWASGICFDAHDKLYFFDNSNGRLRRISDPSPDPGAVTGAGSVCVGADITLANTTADLDATAAWSSSATGVATVNSTGIVHGVSTGSATITYSATSSCGTNYTTYSVSVTSVPSVTSITGTGTVCAGSVTTLADATGGGSWSSTNSGVATVSGGTVYGAGSGTSTISYTLSNSCGSNAATTVVTVNTVPVVAGITGTLTVCAGSNTTLANATGGGTWSSGSTAVATVSGTGVVHGITSGNTTISYAVGNTCGNGYSTAVVTVNPSPNAGVISPSAVTLCGGATQTLTSSGDGGGSWSVNNSNSTINAATGVVTGANFTGGTARTSIATYTVTNSCGTATATRTINIKANPNVSYNPGGSQHICTGEVRTLTGSPSTGGHFEWSASYSTVATLSANVATITANTAGGADYVQYIYDNTTNPNVCNGAVPAFVYTVVTKPTYTINGSSPLSTGGGGCAPGSAVLTISVSPAGATGTGWGWSWTPTSPAYATLACTTCVTNTVTAVSSGGSEVLTFSEFGSYCAVASVATYTVTVNACKPDPDGPATITEETKGISIYPNPAHGSFTIALPPSSSSTAIRVTDLSGRVVATRISAAASEDISLAGYPAGLYLVLVETEEKRYMAKVLLE